MIDPKTGLPQRDGEEGEVVFTTLTRRGMPLIRYRTGDLARFLPGACPCQTSLRRLGKVRGRIAGSIPLGNGITLTLTEMDEVLFKVPHLLNYQPELTMGQDTTRLKVSVYAASGNVEKIQKAVKMCLRKIPTIKAAINEGLLQMDPIASSDIDWPTNGSVKRMWIAQNNRTTRMKEN